MSANPHGSRPERIRAPTLRTPDRLEKQCLSVSRPSSGAGSQRATFTGCDGTCVVNASAKADVQVVLAGVNYKFNF
jgi:hypothetical protein